MYNIKLGLEYDGTRYQGFEKKNSSASVSNKLSESLRQITGEEIMLFAAVKTDSGVHASHQTVNFKLHQEYPADSLAALCTRLNHRLPMDIRVISASLVPERFHAALNLHSCTYTCRIDTGIVPNVFTRGFAVHFPEALDIPAMSEAAKLLCKKHDFAAFSSGKTKKSTVRTITELTLSSGNEGQELIFTLTADGFLRLMPQLLVGTLLDIGTGKKKIQDIPRILSGEMPCGNPFPAKAFCLTETNYL